MMHGPKHIKFINTQQANQIYQYKNIKEREKCIWLVLITQIYHDAWSTEYQIYIRYVCMYMCVHMCVCVWVRWGEIVLILMNTWVTFHGIFMVKCRSMRLQHGSGYLWVCVSVIAGQCVRWEGKPVARKLLWCLLSTVVPQRSATKCVALSASLSGALTISSTAMSVKWKETTVGQFLVS
jgi:hypothetical protein